ncbi:MAG: GerMN domain-containing protein [Chitinophagaceae bacterium]
MRNKLLVMGMIFIISCNNESPSDKENPEDTMITDEVVLFPPDKLPWVSEFDTIKNEFYLKQQRTVDPDSLTAENLIADLNASWENVKLVLVKSSNDTLYVSIPESEFLGQQMGSAGAQAYMASTTYSLTELNGIKYVNYSMQAGDHASPGTYSRKSFDNYR